MHARYGLAALCLTLLAACERHEAIPDGTAVIDEAVALERKGSSDTAARTLTLYHDSIVVAFADEQLTDVSLRIAATDEDGNPIASKEVENHLAGVGIELAALAVPEDSQVTITLTSGPDASVPGKVPLRVRVYSPSAQSKPEFSAKLAAFKAWSDATDTGLRPDAYLKSGVASMRHAITSLASDTGDKALAAEARLVHARLLDHYELDPRGSRNEAELAAIAFTRLPKPDAADIARARYVEAQGLIDMAIDDELVNPTPAEARKLAADILEALVAPESPVTPIERGRAAATLGHLARSQSRGKDATMRFEQAAAIYKSAGWSAGEREMRFALPMVVVESGRFGDAAAAFEPLLPEIDAIGDPKFRAEACLKVARAQYSTNRLDEAQALLLKALEISRDYQFRSHEASALQGIGFIYHYRADFQQAIAFYDESLKITRTLKDSTDYAFALHTAATVARNNGDMDRALKFATESLEASKTPIAKARNYIELVQYHRQMGNYPASIALCRAGLAVDLGDPRHHAHTDGKMHLALSLIELENLTPKDAAEAEGLIAEAVEISIAMKDQFREIQMRGAQARIKAKLGKTRQARAGYVKTLEVAQDYRARSSSSEIRSSMLRDEQSAFRGLLDIDLVEVARRPAGELRNATPAELAAFEQLERARQRSFGALRVGELDATTAASVDGLLQEMGQKSQRIAALLDTKRDAAQTTELQSLQLDMARLHAELDNLRTSAAAKHEQVAMKARAESQNWRALAPGAVHLSYALGDKHVYVLVRSEAGTQVTRLGPARKALELELAELAKLEVQTHSREIEAALEPVSTALLPAGLLPAGSTTVYIVSEGRIASVPFPALRSPTDPKRRLVETHEVAMVTTLLGVDEAPRAPASRPFRFVALASGNGTYRSAVTADPTPKLNAARKEIGAAAALFTKQDPAAKVKLMTGPDGNAAALRDIWASGADVVHFATHALADLRQPIASLLVLPATDESGKATYLTAGQVQLWRGDADLVFLSACESAIGPPQYAAGMPGLQRSFLRAGARGVIATLAPIEDVLAQQFSEDFYSRYTSGMPAARALSETQRAWLAPKAGVSEAEQHRRRIMALVHAYFAG